MVHRKKLEEELQNLQNTLLKEPNLNKYCEVLCNTTHRWRHGDFRCTENILNSLEKAMIKKV